MVCRHRIVMFAVSVLAVSSLLTAAPARAEDFFSAFVKFFTGQPPEPPRPARPPAPVRVMSYAPTRSPDDWLPSPRRSRGGDQAWCVRTCDGRFFPIARTDEEQESCNAFCPASETKVFWGYGDITGATTEDGKSYPDMLTWSRS
jgi:hypothetical protein